MSLYFCQSTDPLFGILGDYFWAKSRMDAELQFQNKHNLWPHYVRREWGSK
jgi:hypothetical protein